MMPIVILKICGNFCSKQPSTKKWLPGTQEVIAPY